MRVSEKVLGTDFLHQNISFVSIRYMKKFAPILLRVSMAGIIIWFGVSQLTDPNSWLGFLPTWTATLPISQTALVYLNGWFELTFGLSLLLGFYTRFVALLLALHLLDIAYIVGYNAIGIRDLGLALATVSVFLFGSDIWSVDRAFERRNGSGNTVANFAGEKQSPVFLKPKFADVKYSVGDKKR
jgi:uncharacterized membrane protein YphA (DoxX/SURF4 family)